VPGISCMVRDDVCVWRRRNASDKLCTGASRLSPVLLLRPRGDTYTSAERVTGNNLENERERERLARGYRDDRSLELPCTPVPLPPINNSLCVFSMVVYALVLFPVLVPGVSAKCV
jgi:hypothetical protein